MLTFSAPDVDYRNANIWALNKSVESLLIQSSVDGIFRLASFYLPRYRVWLEAAYCFREERGFT